MISPFLPIQDADSIALDFGVFVAEQARTYRVSQSAIIAAIIQQPAAPSQPAATAPTPAPVDAKAEEVSQAASSATPSQAKASKDGGATAQDIEIPANGVTGDASRASDGAGSVAPIQPEAANELQERTVCEIADPQWSGPAARKDAGTSAPEDDEVTGKSVGASAPAAPPQPRPMTKGELVKLCHAEHPDWPASKIAAETGVPRNSVKAFASMFGLKLASQADYEAMVQVRTTEALANNALQSKRGPARAYDRVKAAFDANPGSTTREIAESADVSLSTASTFVGQLRKSDAPAPVRKTGLFNLRDRFGEYLHKNTQTMTRIEASYWQGTEADILSLKKAKPGLRDLTERPAK